MIDRFEVPAELAAHEPPERRDGTRDAVRMLVTDATTGVTRNHRFVDLAALLRPGDLVVANDSATLPAAVDAWDTDGFGVVLHVSSLIAATLWIVEPREHSDGGRSALTDSERRLLAARRLRLRGGGAVTLLAPVDERSSRLWYASPALEGSAIAYLHAFGRPIRYGYAGAFPLTAYQTIFAREPGSAEMPSAGRPFTQATLSSLAVRGIAVATITLHTGVSSQESHEPPYAERFAVPERTIEAIGHARSRHGRVIAIGTTVVRALESAVDRARLRATDGWTERLVTADAPPAVADGLLTGLHEPHASHLAMLAGFIAPSSLQSAYRIALRERYRWHEFGDVHLIAPSRDLD